MKKMFSLLIIIIIIMFVPFLVFAKEKKIASFDLNKNFNSNMMSYREYGTFNFFVGSEKMSKVNAANGFIYYLEDNKKLADCDISNNCVLDNNISEKDNFTYIFTEEDKEFINNGCVGGTVSTRNVNTFYTKCELLKDYDGIKVSFHNQTTTDYVVNVYGGEDVNSMPLVIAQGIYSNYFNDKLNSIMKYTISDANNKILSKITANNYGFNVSPENFGIENEYYTNKDVSYTLTESDKNEYNVPFDEIVLNYSGAFYPDNVLSINMKDDNDAAMIISKGGPLFVLFDNNIIKLKIEMYFQDKEDQTIYSGVDITNIATSKDIEALFDGIVIVDENTTFTYDISDNSSLRELIPANYNRLIVNFIQKREASDNTNNNKSKGNIIVNPKTYSRIIITTILIMLLVSTLFIDKIFAKSK